MTEKKGYQFSEEAKRFIQQSLAAGGGETLRKLAKRSVDPQVVPAMERRIHRIEQIASGVPLQQIAVETDKKEVKVYEQCRADLRYLWNQSSPDTQNAFSTKLVFAPPKRGV